MQGMAKTNPIVVPKDQANGKILHACAALVESVISATMLFIIPAFPFRAPVRHRLRPLRQPPPGKKGIPDLFSPENETQKRFRQTKAPH